MSDIRDRLEREARRIQADPDALGKTTARAQRRHRQRRVVSGVVALAVAAAGTLVVVRTFDRTGASQQPRPAGEGSTGAVLPIWPSSGMGTDAAYLDGIQQQVDEGHQPWYLSPQIVGEVFAMEVLEWERRDIQASVRGDTPVQVAITNPALSGAMGDVRTILTLERWRGREDGIFVITHADSEILDLRTPAPGDPIPATDKLTFSGALQGISQRLLALRLTISIEGGRPFGSYESISPNEFTEGEPSNPSSGGPPDGILQTGSKEVVPGPDGEFETTLAMPFDVPPMPGVSVYVRDAAGTKIAVETFRLGPPVPSESPTPGPTPTSDDATPAPIPVQLIDATGSSDSAEVIEYTTLLLQNQGSGTHHGGYSVEAQGEGQAPSDVTTIYCDPANETEASRMVDLLFPGAEVRTRLPSGDPDIVIIVGRDHVDRHAGPIEAFRVVHSFMKARLIGSGAEAFLTDEAESLYERRYGGLSLYGYTAQARTGYRVAAIYTEGDRYRAIVAIETHGSTRVRSEQFRLGRPQDPGAAGPPLLIEYAERNS